MDSDALAWQLACQADIKFQNGKPVAELRLHDGTQKGTILRTEGPTTNTAYRSMKQLLQEMPNRIGQWSGWLKDRGH